MENKEREEVEITEKNILNTIKKMDQSLFELKGYLKHLYDLGIIKTEIGVK